MRLICQKNREKKGTRFHPGLPGELFSDSGNSKRVKSYFSKRRFYSTKSKKFKKIVISKKFKKSKKRHRNV